MNVGAGYRDRVTISRSSGVRAAVLAVLVPVCAAGLVACGGDDAAEQVPLTGLVLPADAVPEGFTVVPAAVSDLIAGNRETLRQAESVTFSPPECRPEADGEFNPALTESNTVLLVASSETATMSEVVSEVERNIDADRRATTGTCRVVTAEPTQGSLAGANIVTSTTELPGPTGDMVEQSLVIRSDSVTTLPDQKVRVRSALLSNALVRRPNGGIVTVQVNVGGVDGGVLDAVPDRLEPPMAESEFTELVQKAVDRAAR